MAKSKIISYGNTEIIGAAKRTEVLPGLIDAFEVVRGALGGHSGTISANLEHIGLGGLIANKIEVRLGKGEGDEPDYYQVTTTGQPGPESDTVINNGTFNLSQDRITVDALWQIIRGTEARWATGSPDDALIAIADAVTHLAGRLSGITLNPGPEDGTIRQSIIEQTNMHTL